MRLQLNQLLLLGVLALFSTGLSAQLEIGVKGGFSVYSGDYSPSTYGIFADDLNFAGGAYLRYRPTQRFGIRINGNFGRLSAERDVILPNETGERVRFERSFRTSLSEFNLVGELDLFYLGDPDANFVAPYVYAGFGFMSFNPQSPDREGNLVDLQPLRTEAQGQDNSRYDAAPYELTQIVGIIGGGVRVRFADRFVVGLEIGGRVPGTDYLDDTSDRVINYQDVLRGPEGTTAAFFSNPTVVNPGETNDFEYRRGSAANDYYLIGSLTFGITIGEGGNKGGCYSF
ncbi:DUF6089 family protein [Neolewinella antarctica]|uniref:DUF6089 domain-containing protein n=1 Tax=Neolewinella antarctica TaxID=442734 RepID=A0ABX0X971_9BACT|nr:DUF6089 family protein [Neolewinella antarctica]NJC25551.1 hypothetical protein [Neolewinella antarctica]